MRTLLLVSLAAWTFGAAPGPPAVAQDFRLDRLHWSRPALRITSRGGGRLALWASGTPVTVTWRERALDRARVRVEVSRDRGRTWTHIGSAPADALTWTGTYTGTPGPALVRIIEPSTRTSSPARRIVVVVPATKVAYGNLFGCALHADGRVRVWGTVPMGAFSDGDWSIRRPRVLDGLTDVRELAAGGNHIVAVDADGATWLWGQPGGNSSPPAEVIAVPRRVEGIGEAIWARASGGRTVVGLRDGTVLGISHDGWSVRLDGTRDPIDVPVEIPELRGARDLALGRAHGVALLPDGTVVTFGSNFSGALGRSTPRTVDGPDRVPGIVDAVAIAGRADSSMVLLADGSVLVWGDAQKLLEPSATLSFDPLLVPSLPPVVAIVCGDGFALARTAEGRLFAWGSNGSGEVGDGTIVDRRRPVECLVNPVSQVFAGLGNVQVLTPDGLRFGWGTGLYGLMGDGGYRTRIDPVPIYSR